MSDLVIMLMILCATGALAGLGAGLFGIGGGAIVVPALYFAFSYLGFEPATLTHTAVATSAAMIIINSIGSVRAHDKLGNVDWSLLLSKPLYKSYALWVGLGAFFASAYIAPRLSGAALTLLFGVLALFMALQFIFGRPGFTLARSVPGGAAIPTVGTTVGVLSALIGIGGGSLSVPLMCVCSVPVHRAVGTASGFGFAIGVPATLGFVISGWGRPDIADYSLGYVHVPSFVLLSVAAFFFVPLGAKLANRLPQTTLKRSFGVLLFLIGLNLIRKTYFGG